MMLNFRKFIIRAIIKAKSLIPFDNKVFNSLKTLNPNNDNKIGKAFLVITKKFRKTYNKK